MIRKQIYSVVMVFLALFWVLSVGIQQQDRYESASKAMVYITNEGYGGNGSVYKMSEDKLVIVSTYHLLQDSDDVMIYFPNQTVVTGTVIGINEKHDVGFVEVNAEDMGDEARGDISAVYYSEKALEQLEIEEAMEYRFLEWNDGNVSAVTHKGKIGHTNWYIDDFDDYFIYNYCDVEPGMSGCAAVTENGSYIGMMIGGVDNESGTLSAKVIDEIYANL